MEFSLHWIPNLRRVRLCVFVCSKAFFIFFHPIFSSIDFIHFLASLFTLNIIWYLLRRRKKQPKMKICYNHLNFSSLSFGCIALKFVSNSFIINDFCRFKSLFQVKMPSSFHFNWLSWLFKCFPLLFRTKFLLLLLFKQNFTVLYCSLHAHEIFRV